MITLAIKSWVKKCITVDVLGRKVEQSYLIRKVKSNNDVQGSVSAMAAKGFDKGAIE